MKRNQILGISLIILSWIFWAMIIAVPFLKLGTGITTVAITILYIASNVFWIGVVLAGNEYLQKYKLWPKFKNLFGKDIFGGKRI